MKKILHKMWFIIVRKSGIGSDVWNMIISLRDDDGKKKTKENFKGNESEIKEYDVKTYKILTKDMSFFLSCMWVL